jgi:hypothetical protein
MRRFWLLSVSSAISLLIGANLAPPLAAQTPSASGMLLTIAGGGADAGEDVPALSASMEVPRGLAIGADGKLSSVADHWDEKSIASGHNACLATRADLRDLNAIFFIPR